ncbi:hypothetical protein COCC4DRAFT_113077, partial [Bipolaris maydis ATCC 48331]
AAASGDIPALELLMNCGYTTDTRADDQSTALHCAARSGQARTVQYLLERGASCEAWNDKYRTPLHEAILSSDSDTVKVLIQHKSEDYRTYLSSHPLRMLTIIHIAARYGNIEVVKQLLRKDDKAVSFRDREGKTPLYYAAFKRHWEVVHLLLQH